MLIRTITLDESQTRNLTDEEIAARGPRQADGSEGLLAWPGPGAIVTMHVELDQIASYEKKQVQDEDGKPQMVDDLDRPIYRGLMDGGFFVAGLDATDQAAVNAACLAKARFELAALEAQDAVAAKAAETPTKRTIPLD